MRSRVVWRRTDRRVGDLKIHFSVRRHISLSEATRRGHGREELRMAGWDADTSLPGSRRWQKPSDEGRTLGVARACGWREVRTDGPGGC